MAEKLGGEDVAFKAVTDDDVTKPVIGATVNVVVGAGVVETTPVRKTKCFRHNKLQSHIVTS